MLPIKIIDRYVIRKFLVLFLLALVSFLIIFHIVDVIEKIDKFLKNEMPLSSVLLYYYYQLPFFIDIAIPMSLLLASVFTIGTLGKNNELGAMKSSGISLYRLATPLLILGVGFSIASYFFEDVIVIPASRKRIEIEQSELRRHRSSHRNTYTNVMYQDSPNCNIVIGKYTTKSRSGKTITVQYSRDNILLRRIDARLMRWIPEQQQWQLLDFKIRRFDTTGNEIVSQTVSDSLFHFNLHPEDIIQTGLDPESMRYSELATFIGRLQQSGNDPKKWEVNLHYKIAFPFTNFIVILFGIPLAAVKERKGISFGAGVSLLIIFVYYGFIKFGQVLGYKGILSPLLSVWLANIIFLIAGGYLLYKIRQ